MGLYNFRTICFPYCLKKLENGKYVVLNREYKPIGFCTREHLEYEKYPIGLDLKITPKQAQLLSWNNSPNVEIIYLYDDETVPHRSKQNWDSYCEKLERLSEYKINNLNHPTT